MRAEGGSLILGGRGVSPLASSSRGELSRRTSSALEVCI